MNTSSATVVSAAASDCFHCGLPVPADANYPVRIDGQARAMCCPGCQAVASVIVDGGLENFYRFRADRNTRPEEENREQWQVFDLPDVQADFVITTDEGLQQARLLLEDITCAACVWLIEHHLQKNSAVKSVKVNATSHRCTVTWDARQLPLSQLMLSLASIGYGPQPASDEGQQALRRCESRQALMRLGVAGFGMMQVGMVAIALYAGALQGISSGWEHYLRWVSWLIATPVVFYSARPFFQAAWRSVLTRHLSMDVPVSIAIGGAYLASCWATLYGEGEVYFDSVSMFTFFLLLGRYLEMRARHHNSLQAGNMAQLMPLTATRLVDGGEGSNQEETVPLKALQPGDRVLVKAGETLPCDGRVLSGRSAVVEALLTGEPLPVPKCAGDSVAAGTLNSESALNVCVTAVGAGTQLSSIERLVEQAQSEKPSQVTIADRLAGYFVGAVLVLSVLVFTVWTQLDPARAFWITLSVLVVTCPCALSLATPVALTAATAYLRRLGLLVTRGHVIEGLTTITRVVLDKTGTLTQGQVSLVSIELCRDDYADRTRVLALAKALEQQANHPIARAFTEAEQVPTLAVQSMRQVTAAGVEGVIEGTRYRLGAEAFVAELFAATGDPVPAPQTLDSSQQILLLGDATGPIAWFALSDPLRDSAPALIRQLREQGCEVELLSGDKSGAVATLAQALGICQYQAGASPDDKLARVQELQAAGEKVLMVGDGINDVPVLSGADISVAMAAASDLAQTRADSVLLNGDLTVISRALASARNTRRIIGQNLSWALAYNGLALPLAALGWVPPYAAAIGMSASSLVVIVNALRLNRD